MHCLCKGTPFNIGLEHPRSRDLCELTGVEEIGGAILLKKYPYAQAANDVDVLTNEAGDRVTPSYVSFTEDEHVVGLPAKQQMARNAKNTVFGVKRVLGKKYVVRLRASGLHD